MASKRTRTDKHREQKRCGGCDCFETCDGCECRIVPCSRCGSFDRLYNMNHPEFHTDHWFDGMDFYEKLSTVLCDECENGCSSDEDD